MYININNLKARGYKVYIYYVFEKLLNLNDFLKIKFIYNSIFKQNFFKYEN